MSELSSSSPKQQVTIQGLRRHADDDEIIAAVEKVAEAATDFSWLSRGDTVLLKPACNSPNLYPATTSPLAVLGMVRLLKEKGAGRVILADKPGVEWVHHKPEGEKKTSREMMVRNGLQAAALDAGGEVHYFDEAGYDAYFGERTEHPGHWKGEIMLPLILREVDHVVNLPRVSRHVLACQTLGLKSAVGWLRDDTRCELHRDAASFLDKCAEINDVRTLREKVRLTLSVATKVQATYGPDKGFVCEPDPGLVFASTSLIAHDMIALGWLLWNREFLTPAWNFAPWNDPYVFFPGFVNRVFVGFTWGFSHFLKSETYENDESTSARTDRMIMRAAEMWGGLPELGLEDLTGQLPGPLTRYLMEKATE